MTNVQIYTDGSARGNPDGPGGYGVVLHFTDSQGQLHEKTMSGGYVRTTNNRMELMAAIVGLEALNRPCAVELYSDSKYLTDAFNQHWIDSWIMMSWQGNSNSFSRCTKDSSILISSWRSQIGWKDADSDGRRQCAFGRSKCCGVWDYPE